MSMVHICVLERAEGGGGLTWTFAPSPLFTRAWGWRRHCCLGTLGIGTEVGGMTPTVSIHTRADEDSALIPPVLLLQHHGGHDSVFQRSSLNGERRDPGIPFFESINR